MRVSVLRGFFINFYQTHRKPTDPLDIPSCLFPGQRELLLFFPLSPSLSKCPPSLVVLSCLELHIVHMIYHIYRLLQYIRQKSYP